MKQYAMKLKNSSEKIKFKNLMIAFSKDLDIPN